VPRTHRVNPRTARKCVWLTDETRAAVQAWADRTETSFSAALETLARVGLGEAPERAVAPALVSTVRREIQQQMHRLASLYAATAIEAGVASRLSGAALRTLRPEEYERSSRRRGWTRCRRYAGATRSGSWRHRRKARSCCRIGELGRRCERSESGCTGSE
jgi:hypothetical protein